MRERITEKLKDIERDQDVTILYSCESGSRAWQFASPDSDYDVRFIYIRKAADYLSISEKDEQLSFPIVDELDIYGWDIRKLLRLMRRSNVTPFEWMQSSTIYRDNPEFVTALSELAGNYFDARANACHYLGIVRTMTGGNMDELNVTVKSLFYILRSLLSAMWNIERREIAPLTIYRLMELLPDSLQMETEALIALKATLPEKQEIKASPALKQYIQTAFMVCEEKISSLKRQSFAVDGLDAFFLKTLKQYDYR